ncbi:hypothetical protein [Wolbachia endosymbiont of Atemnus politus]|uniref:hypothetical protein n=1 Tax=Wolbachia endosymbiont of Atemnus politus TaxID=2682840 RepID=UPI0039797349
MNLLINSKNAARVSSKPGYTRQINFYTLCTMISSGLGMDILIQARKKQSNT